MLEKLAEMVREEAISAVSDVPCFICLTHKPCAQDKECPYAINPDGSLMLARWAVLLVARGLEKELRAIEEASHTCTKSDADGPLAVAAEALTDLIAEARQAEKEDAEYGS